MGKLLEDQAAIGGKALTMTHIDSWEVGSQNWTPGFREEFQKRHGYDLLPYLPILTGRAVESREVSERFLWDLRRIVADLLLENYAGHMQGDQPSAWAHVVDRSLRRQARWMRLLMAGARMCR